MEIQKASLVMGSKDAAIAAKGWGQLEAIEGVPACGGGSVG
ncbi:MAG: hypothetical protein WKF75_18185 [Singulisphaera sp.]